MKLSNIDMAINRLKMYKVGGSVDIKDLYDAKELIEEVIAVKEKSSQVGKPNEHITNYSR